MISEATMLYNNETAGRERLIHGVLVKYVANGNPADIVWRRSTADYSKEADRKYILTATGIRYVSLERAIVALIKFRAKSA